ncbi:MAG: hypothetical protein ACI9CE_001487 [Flavobacterium sp.]|jgi:hypothetical protein
MVQGVGNRMMKLIFPKREWPLLTIVLPMALFLSSCTEQEQVSETSSKNMIADSNPSVVEVIEKAETLYAQAVEKEHGWTITTVHIKTAREALAAGHTEEAIDAADRALRTAEASLSQAEREGNAWQARVLKAKK